MTNITHKNLVQQLVSAVTSGSTEHLKSVLSLEAQEHEKNVYSSEVWKNISTQNTSHLTPYKAFALARVLFNHFRSGEAFRVFVENCRPLDVYLRGVKPNQKPSVYTTVQKWVFDSFWHAHEGSSSLFALFNQKLDPTISKLNPQKFLNENDVWWYSIHPAPMQALVDLQPDVAHKLQEIFIGKLNEKLQDLNTITNENDSIEKSKTIQKVVAQSRKITNHYLRMLMRPRSLYIELTSPTKKSLAYDLATCALHGEMYVNLVALQTWSKYGLLYNSQLIDIYNLVSGLGVGHQEKVLNFASVEITDLLDLCQNAYIKNELGVIPFIYTPRKI